MPAQDTATVVGGVAPESRVDHRLLIDGRLITADNTFPSINPATGAVVGHVPDAGVAEARAARRAFDSTGRSADVELRILERTTFATPVLGAPA